MRKLLVLVSLTLVTMPFQNCSKASFSDSSSSLLSAAGVDVPSIPVDPSGPAVCVDVANSENNGTACDASKGFVGVLYVEPRADLKLMPHYGGQDYGSDNASVENFVAHPEWIQGQTVNGVFKPFMFVANGFNYGGMFKDNFHAADGSSFSVPDSLGKTGANSNGASWFALAMRANFHLDAANDPPGEYQFAIIADDGAKLYYLPPGKSAYEMLVDDQTPTFVTINDASGKPEYIPGTQWDRMGCSTTMTPSPDAASIRVLNLAKTDTVPLVFNYYQGPSGLGLQLLYRKVPASGPVDPYCATDANTRDPVKSAVVKAQPQLDLAQVMASWKSIGPANLN